MEAACGTSIPVDLIDTQAQWPSGRTGACVRYQSTVYGAERAEFINELFRRNYALVARWCLRFASDRESAADLAQEVFAKAYQNFASFQGQSEFSTWLFSIARNHCLNFVKANARQATQLRAEGDEDLLGELRKPICLRRTGLLRATDREIIEREPGRDREGRVHAALLGGSTAPRDYTETCIAELKRSQGVSGQRQTKAFAHHRAP
jgi:RNA polymerase sigma factor (sigma-70 family)